MAFGDGLAGAYLPIEQFPLDDTRYLQALEYVVKELARSPSLVILGRGSQFILKGYPGVLHVLVVAPIEVRVKRIMQDLMKRYVGSKTLFCFGAVTRYTTQFFKVF